MNVFTTEHPLAQQPSSFDRKAYPVYSFFCRIIVVAMFLFPILTVAFAVLNDPENIDDFEFPFLDPRAWPASSVSSLILAFAGVSAYRLLAWVYSKAHMRTKGLAKVT